MPTRDEVAGLPSDLQEFFSALAERYAIEHELGRGGHAIVFRAQDLKLKRAVAIKVLRPELSLQVRAERFLREIEIVAGLQHPHIVPLFDSGTAAERLYYVMPHVEGETLETLLGRDGALPIDEAIRYTREIADALSHAHSRGVIHRDVKPGNILLSGGHALVTDFGIARAIRVAGGSTITGEGSVIGTPQYMSPEQAGGGDHVDARGDQYSLACVTYAMLAGEPPFDGPTVQVVLARQLQEPPPSLRVARPTVTVELQGVVERALAKTPADRWPTVAEFGSQLTAGVTAAPPPPPPVPNRGLALGITAAVGAVAFAVWRLIIGPALPLDPNQVVVFPLVEATAGGIGESALEQAALYLVNALDHTEPLRCVDGWTWLTPTQRKDPSIITAAEARAIARSRHARWYIEGTLARHRDYVTVVLWLFDAAGDSLVARVNDAGHMSQPVQVSLRALNKILPRLLAPDRRVDLTVLTERHPGAVASWLQGEQEYRRSRFGSALAHYRRAVERDSALAIAALKGAWAAHWEHEQVEALRFVDLALRQRQQLPARYFGFASALRSYLTGGADSAAAGFRRAADADPAWVEAWTALGEVYYHLLPADGQLEAGAESAFTRALAEDPGFAPALFHLGEISLRGGQLDRAQRLFELFRASSPDSAWLVQARLMVECVREGAKPAEWLATAATHPGPTLQAAKGLASVHAYATCAAVGYDAVLRSTAASADERFGAVAGLQTLLVTDDDLEGARAVLDTALQAGMSATAGLFVIDALAGHAVDERRARDAIASLGTDLGTMSTRALWWRGKWAQHVQDLGELGAVARLMEKRTRGSQDPSERLQADVLSAYATLARGDTAAAIRGFRALRPVATGPEIAWGFWEALAEERIMLAELLLARGGFVEALRVARTIAHPQPLTFRLRERRSLEIQVAAADGSGDRVLARDLRARLTTMHRASTDRHSRPRQVDQRLRGTP
jgi:serine/threonine-protein kinase